MSVYNFTLELVKRMNQETGSHFVTSALTPWTLLLVMTSQSRKLLGGSDAARQEIREVLQLHPHSCFVFIYLKLVNQVTMKPDDPALSTLERSSTIFFNASEKTNQNFFDVLSKAGIYSSRIMYFVDHKETAHSINDHVKSFTDDYMKDIVKPDDLDGLLTLTIDALTFKGVWKIPFPFEDTDTDEFFDNEDRIQHVPIITGAYSKPSIYNR
ncbi:hypothetical protein PYW08_009974 [Mythimna loreyi]|uniref:Uncharacterized protein n=1 Tax=Mythimna loreyi TaxID=667449 RepID=A0ACC2Q5W8_9NEOP|nr:hypothetical protein PYW08_009974 [Mythimna loreyi]